MLTTPHQKLFVFLIAPALRRAFDHDFVPPTDHCSRTCNNTAHKVQDMHNQHHSGLIGTSLKAVRVLSAIGVKWGLKLHYPVNVLQLRPCLDDKVSLLFSVVI